MRRGRGLKVLRRELVLRSYSSPEIRGELHSTKRRCFPFSRYGWLRFTSRSCVQNDGPRRPMHDAAQSPRASLKSTSQTSKNHIVHIFRHRIDVACHLAVRFAACQRIRMPNGRGGGASRQSLKTVGFGSRRQHHMTYHDRCREVRRMLVSECKRAAVLRDTSYFNHGRSSSPTRSGLYPCTTSSPITTTGTPFPLKRR